MQTQKEQKPSRHWSPEETARFYEDILNKALSSIPESGAVMILGPMFIIRTPEENFALFEKARDILKERGLTVFDQVPLVDYNLVEAPFDYVMKFQIYYKGLIHSGKIKACYLLPGWEQSEGTKQEISFCHEKKIPVFTL